VAADGKGVLLRRRAPASAAGVGSTDAGVTLIELVVSMSLMSFATAIISSGFVQMYRVLDINDAQTSAQQQLSTAFERLDRDVRYAAGISSPAVVNGDWYVEYLMDAGGTPTCVELRLHGSTAQLQRRGWASGSSVAPTAWMPIASGVTATVPFVLLPADAALNFQRLQVALQSTAGNGPTASSRQSSSTWAALNATQPTDTVCTERRSVA
jgi:type II secretory pathway pseudopilin PulG